MAVVEGTHVSVGITHRTAAAQSVRAAARRQTCSYSEESTFQEPFYKFFYVHFDVIGAFEAFENEDLLPVRP